MMWDSFSDLFNKVLDGDTDSWEEMLLDFSKIYYMWIICPDKCRML